MGRIGITVAITTEAYARLRDAANRERRAPYVQAEVILERVLRGFDPFDATAPLVAPPAPKRPAAKNGPDGRP
jgi:hypothetical protein